MIGLFGLDMVVLGGYVDLYFYFNSVICFIAFLFSYIIGLFIGYCFFFSCVMVRLAERNLVGGV